jgi:hypothetical protein
LKAACKSLGISTFKRFTSWGLVPVFMSRLAAKLTTSTAVSWPKAHSREKPPRPSFPSVVLNTM